MKRNNFSYQTSEKIQIEYNIASGPLRVSAFLLDIAILTAFFWVLYFLFIFLAIGGAFFSGVLKSNFTIYIILIVYMIIGLLILLYPFLFEWIWKGQTPGKRIMNLRAVNDDGSYLNFTSIVLRNVFRIVDALPVSYLAGFITMLLNKRRKRIGDFVAGTIVIREKDYTLPKFGKETKLELFSNIRGLKKKFSDSDKELIESYFRTKKDLYFKALDEIEKELIKLIEKRTGVRKTSKVSDEDYIACLYQQIE